MPSSLAKAALTLASQSPASCNCIATESPSVLIFVHFCSHISDFDAAQHVLNELHPAAAARPQTTCQFNKCAAANMPVSCLNLSNKLEQTSYSSCHPAWQRQYSPGLQFPAHLQWHGHSFHVNAVWAAITIAVCAGIKAAWHTTKELGQREDSLRHWLL